MSSTVNDPTENTSTYLSPPTMDRDDHSDDGASSDVSCGGNLRDDLEAALKGDFDFRGRFALTETFAPAPLPGLYIDGIGIIGFPLSERDAKLIEAAAIQAPFSFNNPAWTTFLHKVTKNMADGLGLPPNRPPPRAELYKLLLYKTGSHFLPHKDTEKSQGMFASLIIVLPSKFKGGEVHVSHGNSQDVFDISPSSEFATSALAWYTDVTHQVKPVTSGYRLAISYNLVNTSPDLPPPHLSDMHSAVSAVENIFRKWRKGGYNDPNFSGNIAHLLDHEYSGASLEFAALKGKDANLVSSIKRSAERQGISLNLGLLECEVSGDAGGMYYSDSDDGWGRPTPRMEIVEDTEYRIDGLYDLEGDLASEGDPITLDPEFDMIPKDPGFEGTDPDDEEFEGYTGNEGAPMKYWYRRSALVMTLEEDSPTMLGRGGPDYAFTKLRRWRAEGPTDRNRETARFILSRGRLGAPWSHTLSNGALLPIDLALEWGDLAMWEQVLDKSKSGGNTPQLGLDLLVRAWDVFTFDRVKHTIEKAIRGHTSTKPALELIRALQAHAPAQDQQNVKVWLKGQTTAVLSSIKLAPTANDVQMFVGTAESEGLLYFSETILKQLIGLRQMFDFWVGLAEGLWKSRDKLIPSGATQEEASAYTTALNHVLDSLIAAAVPECYSGLAYNRYDVYTFAYREPQDQTRVLKLLDLMAVTHRTRDSNKLFTLVSQPQGNLLVKYRGFITPLVSKLKARYQQYNRSEFPLLDGFLRTSVGRWLQDLLGTSSKQPEALIKRVPCECQDCAKVNRFLQSSAVTETFRAAQKRRSHVEASLKNALPGDVTLTTIVRGSPHGLQVTKSREASLMDKWSGRVESARAFLALVGTPNELARIMGNRYQDVQAALAGTRPYRMGNLTPVVAFIEDPPVASTSANPAMPSGTQTGPVTAGVKRKAEDDGDVIDLTSD